MCIGVMKGNVQFEGSRSWRGDFPVDQFLPICLFHDSKPW